MKTKVLLAATALALATLAPSAASAQSPDAATVERASAIYQRVMAVPDSARGAYWKALPKSQKRLFRRYVKPDYVVRTKTIEPTSASTDVSPAFGGCWTATISDSAYSLLGTQLFTYRLKMDWCGKDGIIADLCDTCFGFKRPVDVYLGWQFVRHSDFDQRGGLGKLSWDVYTQGEFRFCVVNDIGCLQHLYPWLEMKVWPNSYYQWWKSDV